MAKGKTKESENLSDLMGVRPEVIMFAQLMEKVLKQHDHKGGWLSASVMDLANKLIGEVDELMIEVINWATNRKENNADEFEAIRHECADVANYAMMISDIFYLHKSNLLAKEVSDDR